MVSMNKRKYKNRIGTDLPQKFSEAFDHEVKNYFKESCKRQQTETEFNGS